MPAIRSQFSFTKKNWKQQTHRGQRKTHNKTTYLALCLNPRRSFLHKAFAMLIKKNKKKTARQPLDLHTWSPLWRRITCGRFPQKSTAGNTSSKRWGGLCGRQKFPIPDDTVLQFLCHGGSSLLWFQLNTQAPQRKDFIRGQRPTATLRVTPALPFTFAYSAVGKKRKMEGKKKLHLGANFRAKRVWIGDTPPPRPRLYNHRYVMSPWAKRASLRGLDEGKSNWEVVSLKHNVFIGASEVQRKRDEGFPLRTVSGSRWHICGVKPASRKKTENGNEANKLAG